jgi:hypothetical protein
MGYIVEFLKINNNGLTQGLYRSYCLITKGLAVVRKVGVGVNIDLSLLHALLRIHLII